MSIEEISCSGERRLLLANEHIRMVVAPHHGGRVLEIVRTGSGGDLAGIDASCRGGFLSDHIPPQSCPGEYWDLPYDYDVLSKGPECIAVKLSARGLGNPTLIVSKTISLKSRECAIGVEYELANKAAGNDVAEARHSLVTGLRVQNRIRGFPLKFYTATNEGPVIVRQYNDRQQSEQSESSPMQGWMASVNDAGEGMGVRLNYPDLDRLYWHPLEDDSTFEWYYRMVSLAPGDHFRTVFTLIPFGGLNSVERVSRNVVCSFDYTPGKATLAVFSSITKTVVVEFAARHLPDDGYRQLAGQKLQLEAGAVSRLMVPCDPKIDGTHVLRASIKGTGDEDPVEVYRVTEVGGSSGTFVLPAETERVPLHHENVFEKWAGTPATVQPVDVGSRSQLFIDNMFMAASRDVKFVVNPPRKTECVLKPEKAWEAYGISVSSVFQDGDVYKMYYGCFATAPPPEGKTINCGHCGRTVPDNDFICRHCARYTDEAVSSSLNNVALAISGDGLHWERPILGAREFRGSPDNNLVDMRGLVCIDPRPRNDMQYLSLEDGDVLLSASRDGISVAQQIGKVTPFLCDTANQLMWDPNIERYVAYLRGFDGRRKVVRTEMDDPYQLPWPHREGVDLDKVQPETYVTNEMPTVIDGTDYETREIYNPCMHIYPHTPGGVYLAFPSVYRWRPALPGRPYCRSNRGTDDGTNEIYIFVSRDGKAFNLPARTPYLAPGTEDEPDRGTLYMGVGMITHGDEIWQYYTAKRITHGFWDPGTDRDTSRIFRLVQKRDRFVGVRADEDGEIVTPPIIFEGNLLELNIDCGGLGGALVAILDSDGNPLPGRTLDDFDPIDLNHLHATCSWFGEKHIGNLAGKPVRLHIRLQYATIYGFRFKSL